MCLFKGVFAMCLDIYCFGFQFELFAAKLWASGSLFLFYFLFLCFPLMGISLFCHSWLQNGVFNFWSIFLKWGCFISFGSSFSGGSNCWLVFRICSGDVKVNISSEMKKKKEEPFLFVNAFVLVVYGVCSYLFSQSSL